MFSRLTDEQLVEIISSKGDKYAELTLIERLRRNAFFIARLFFECHPYSGITLDEYYAVALESIHVAAKKFDHKHGNKFTSFYRVVAENDLRRYDAENSYIRKGKVFAGITSFNVVEKGEKKKVCEELGDVDPLVKGQLNMSDMLVSFNKVFNKMSKKEKDIYTLFLKGYEVKQIVEILKIPTSTVYRILSKVLKTIHKEIMK